MVFKLNIGFKGKSWKIDKDDEILIGKSIGDQFKGNEIGEDFANYEFEITGGSDFSGFPLKKGVEGIGLKRVLLKKGWGMKDKRKGVRIRKTLRGQTISDKTVQINLKVLKEGTKKIEEIFPDQNKKEEPKQETTPEKSE